ncbi:putative BTB/POZ domain-containing protein [Cotonvirus japonicus]|uniref:BTB/POZ domain-containing protein n=1 Tax=Cotonvirus japonicus TaxID=2811091 RepID=A0ABM7NTN7_9VIRU|nr:putative BTB/POZ domain-containing protein [Cotonvirus japonicus]BCS83548.1 putative BTB/POZ domain-containing protein [Cotonvirus japonicus]
MSLYNCNSEIIEYIHTYLSAQDILMSSSACKKFRRLLVNIFNVVVRKEVQHNYIFLMKNLSKVCVYYKSDIIIYLLSDNSKISINVNRKIITQIPAFQNVVDFMEIVVPDRYICYDIIKKLHGFETNIMNYPKWHHCLLSFICRNYLGIEDHSYELYELYDLIIPESDRQQSLDLLLTVVNMIGINSTTKELILRNLPCGYDPDSLPLL